MTVTTEERLAALKARQAGGQPATAAAPTGTVTESTVRPRPDSDRMPSYTVPWDRVSAGGAAVVSFVSMMAAMGPLFEGADAAVTTVADAGVSTGGESAVAGASAATDPVAPVVDIQVAPVDPAPIVVDPTAAQTDRSSTSVDPVPEADASVGQVPAAPAPGAQIPATQAQATQAPAQAAETQPPTTAAPSTQAPATQPPATATVAPPRSEGSGG